MSTLPPPPPPPPLTFLHHSLRSRHGRVMNKDITFSPLISHFPTPHLTPKIQSLPSFLHHSIRSEYKSAITTIFLTNDEVEKLEYLNKFTYRCKLPSGYLTIRAMKESELDMVVGLLSESFAESMLLPSMYLTVLGFLIRQYLVEKRGLVPHAVTLLGFYCHDHGGGGGDGDGDGSGGEDGGGVFAGTVEVSFNKRGASSSPPSPTPPKECPYICNMTVHKSLRRKGIGWHLLKASEELISTMTCSRNVYLHCRMIDFVPLNMYKKAGYDIVKTDSLLILLTLQRRKHLMCKELPVVSEPREVFVSENEAVVLEMDWRGPEPPLLPDEDVQR